MSPVSAAGFSARSAASAPLEAWTSIATGRTKLRGGQPHAPKPEDVAIMDAAALGRWARRSLAEGDLKAELWQQYASRAAELVDELSMSDTARLASAFSTARFVDFDFYSRLSSRALHWLQLADKSGATVGGAAKADMTSATAPPPAYPIVATDLQRLAVAFGRARAFDSELMEAMVPAMSACVGDFSPRELARVADAYARMPVQSLELFALVAEAMPQYVYDLEPGDLVGLCRAFAEAAVYNKELTDVICAESVRRLRSLGAYECLVLLDGLSQLHAGLPEELRRDDASTLTAVLTQLAISLGSLAAPDLIRVFASLVRLDHYDPRFVHGKLCPALAQKLGQLETSARSGAHFRDLAQMLHCLSLLPGQSHKSAELALSAADALRLHPLLAGRSRRQPEPSDVALAAAAVGQLGQDDEELVSLLGSVVTSHTSPGSARHVAAHSEFLDSASEEELYDLRKAFGLSRASSAAASALAAIDGELERRGFEPDPQPPLS